ncbi:hypothetical protein V7x_54760 [Crateriforma conspicua]|uniref:Secreted protein n=1 Tax=Crateriforma conspicua TaxID=2527996 RepID=A0A5C6FFY2_9PLAN|nr:hypothetical protein [Crateriforma conspicua]TWU59702.1 hypothetical protein V7x_54760 [Crateriforma conspicua]
MVPFRSIIAFVLAAALAFPPAVMASCCCDQTITASHPVASPSCCCGSTSAASAADVLCGLDGNRHNEQDPSSCACLSRTESFAVVTSNVDRPDSVAVALLSYPASEFADSAFPVRRERTDRWRVPSHNQRQSLLSVWLK